MTTTTTRYPLANDADGNPLDVPEHARAWRVRRGGGRRGRPRIVFDNETGRQMEVPLESTIEDLVDHGCPPGRYRLEAVDSDGKLIPGVVAVTEIPVGPGGANGHADAEEEDGPSEGGGGDHFTRMVTALERQSNTLCQALSALATAFGPVRPAQVPIIMGDGPSGDSGGMKPDQLAQLFGTVAEQVIKAWKGSPSSGGGAT